VDPDLAHDKALVDRAKRDPEAFGAIFDAYYSKILSYALKRLGDAHLAEDVTAETFAKALRGLWRYRWQGVPLSAWLYTIAGNEVRMYLRKKRPGYSLNLLIETGYDVADESVVAERNALEAHLREDALLREVSDALKTLPPKYQEAVALRYMEGKSYTEIAFIMKRREGAIRSLVSRGLSMVREELAKAQQKESGGIMESEGRGALSAMPQRNV
jgi:RNA polymerase sigma-70 factor (ECF subfamily)